MTQTRDLWLAERRTGIGGSDVAAILGLNEYSSPYAVWADKLGLLPDKNDTEAMRLGRDMEAYVADRFCEREGVSVRRVNRILRHPDYPFMLANVDRMVNKSEGKAGLECKTTSVLNLSKFKGGEYPANYYCQCMHYMAVTGAACWYLAVIVLNQDFMVYRIERDEDEIAALIKVESEFWQMVQDETPPPIDGSDATRRALEAVNPMDPDKPPALLYGMEDLIERRDCLNAEKKHVQREIDEINNKLKAGMGGATRGIMRGYELTLRTIQKQPYTVTPKPYTQLYIKEVADHVV